MSETDERGPERHDGDEETPGVQVPDVGVSVPDAGIAPPDPTAPAPAGVPGPPAAGVSVPDAGIAVPDVALTPPEPAAEPRAEPQDGGMPAPAETGDPRVDAAVRPLADLGEAPTEEHVGAYEDAHSGLQEALADLDRDQPDEQQGRPSGQGPG